MRQAVDGFLADLSLPPEAAPLVAGAQRLATTLDDGAGSQTAAVHRELRATLERIRDLARPAEPTPLDRILARRRDAGPD